MGVKYEARPSSELFTLITGDMSCQELSSTNWFQFEDLRGLLIFTRFGPVGIFDRLATSFCHQNNHFLKNQNDFSGKTWELFFHFFASKTVNFALKRHFWLNQQYFLAVDGNSKSSITYLYLILLQHKTRNFKKVFSPRCQRYFGYLMDNILDYNRLYFSCKALKLKMIIYTFLLILLLH